MHNKPSFVCLLFVSLLLHACTLAPRYSRPPTALPDTQPAAWQQNAQGSGQGNAQTYTQPLDKQWWTQFQSPALIELQRIAVSANYLLSAKGWEVRQALAQAKITRAPLFPWIGAQGDVSRIGDHKAPGQAFSMKDIYSGGFQAAYEIDIWGKTQAALDRDSFLAQATSYDRHALHISLEADIATSYFAYLAHKERLRVQQRILTSLQKTEQLIAHRVAAGAASPLDLARQRGIIAEVQAKTQELQRHVAETKNVLHSLLSTLTLDQGLLQKIEEERLHDIRLPHVPAGLPASLLTRRPDILRTEAVLQAANANIGAARSAFLPAIQLTAMGGWQSDALHSLINPASSLYTLASSLVAPIFQGGQLKARHDKALAQYEEMLARYQHAALQAFLETDTAIAALAFLQQEEQHRRDAAAHAKEAYRIVQVQYEEGAETFLAVLDAQRTMLQTEDMLVLITLARLNTSVALYKALGGGWQP